MTIRFEELPGWDFDVREVSAGVYRVTGQDQAGRRVVTEGLDPEASLEDCRASALGVFGDRQRQQAL